MSRKELEQREAAMTVLREQVKLSSWNYSSIAFQCGKSKGWIGEIFRGNYPYRGANLLPQYLRVWLESSGFIVADIIITY